MQHKWTKWLAVFLIAALFLAACGGNNATPQNGNTGAGGDGQQAGDGNGGTEDVTFWYYFGGNEEQELIAKIDQYNASQNRYGQYIPFGDMKKRLSVGILGDQLPDLATIDNPDHASFAASGILEDITARVEEWGQAGHYLEGPLNSAKYEGKLYGLPFTSNTLALFYNVDMFAEAGIENPPAAWDELREAAGKLTKDNVTGLGFAATKSEEGTFDYLPWLWSTGADYDSLDSEDAIRALRFLTGLIEDGSVSKEVINLNNSDTVNQFAQGTLAMMINGPWNIPMVKNSNPDLNFAIAKIPADKQEASVLGGENIAVIKGGNVDGAWDFLRWLSEPEQLQSYLEKTGYFPPRKDIAEQSEHWKNDPYLSGFLEQMESARPRGPHPKWPEISSVIQTMYQEAFSLAVEPEKAAEKAANEIRNILAD